MYELKNYTETVVKQTLETYLRSNVLSCSCERCQADIMALTLNRLPARYYVSPRGEIMTQLESQTLPDQTRIMTEIILAAQQVAATPSHPTN